MKKIKPLADRVVIRPNAAEEKTDGGLIIPKDAQKKQKKGTVEAVGPGTHQVKMTVVKGDYILYGQYAGTELKVEGNDFIIMRQSDILAII